MILALDQALETSGYGVFKGDTLVNYGNFKVDPKQGIQTRLVKFAENLSELKRQYDFDELYFEGIQYQNNAETHKKLAYVQATVLLWCYENKVAYEILAPSEWRRILGGNFGKTRKEQKACAIEYVKSNFNYDVSSDEADAICIGCASVSLLREEKANECRNGFGKHP